jgi:hypothetical protein
MSKSEWIPKAKAIVLTIHGLIFPTPEFTLTLPRSPDVRIDARI